jgi:hypothetical protein
MRAPKDGTVRCSDISSRYTDRVEDDPDGSTCRVLRRLGALNFVGRVAMDSITPPANDPSSKKIASNQIHERAGSFKMTRDLA